MIPPKISGLAFYSSLLVPGARRTELRLIPPVRTKSYESCALVSLASPQNLLHRARQVVIPQYSEDSTEVGEGLLVRFEKRLLRGPRISSMKRTTAGHAPHREHLNFLTLAVQVRISFIPIYLRFAAPLVYLRHVHLSPQHSELFLPSLHIPAHMSFRHLTLRHLFHQPLVNPMRGVTLLARRLLVAFEDLIDELHKRRQLRPFPLRPLALRRHGVLQSLPHHPPVHPQLLGDRSHRAIAKLVLASDLFK